MFMYLQQMLIFEQSSNCTLVSYEFLYARFNLCVQILELLPASSGVPESAVADRLSGVLRLLDDAELGGLASARSPVTGNGSFRN